MSQAKKIITTCILSLSLGLTTASLISCSSSSTQNKAPIATGFLPNYSLLKPVANSPQGFQIYTYTNPAIKRSDYTAVIVAPVVLYQSATSTGITDDQIQAARGNIQSGVQQIVSKTMTITNNPGPGVATLSIAITGASLQGSGFSPRNLIPISAAIKLASMAANTDSSTPIMVVELKITDSVSGRLLRETVTTVSGEQFRNKANTSQEFQQLAQTWVQQALQYSSTQTAS